jgi:squalene-hopene/tetraprenyl-beta-curcumene cyclase
MAAGRSFGGSVQAGIEYLLRAQQADGSWMEDSYTGTGFPRAFYLRYDLYRIYFPLMALARYKAWLEDAA